MIEIIGTQMSEHSLIGDCVGAAVGALLIASTLYIVAKIKQEYKVQDEKNAALLEGENYPDWKLERVETWFKGYKVALIECLLLGFFFGAGAGVLGMRLGWVDGVIEVGTLAGIASIVSGLLLDKYLIHPIADGKFMEQVETPLIEKFLGVASDAAEDAPEDLKQLAQKLRDKGLI